MGLVHHQIDGQVPVQLEHRQRSSDISIVSGGRRWLLAHDAAGRARRAGDTKARSGALSSRRMFAAPETNTSEFRTSTVTKMTSQTDANIVDANPISTSLSDGSHGCKQLS